MEPPLFVELAITETEPGFKGDTATGANKPATVETGAQVYVPLFVNEGDVIKIDTEPVNICPEYKSWRYWTGWFIGRLQLLYTGCSFRNLKQ